MVRKVYCYVDESGQDSKGKFFLVGSVVLDQEDSKGIREKLEKVEFRVKKGRRKWQGLSLKKKIGYLSEISKIKKLKASLFYSYYKDTKEYELLTAVSAGKAILDKIGDEEYKVTIYLDGLTNTASQRVRKELKKLKVKYRKVRGLNHKSSPFIRLADALAGFTRDYVESAPYTKTLFRKLMDIEAIKEI